jgi:hypothetical protein
VIFSEDNAEVIMVDQPRAPLQVPTRGFPLAAAIVLSVLIIACSVYANLSFAVTDKNNYRFFPPFKPFLNANMNGHLGAEYFNIAKSIHAGEGFASPFKEKTGPTAWMPPVLPAIQAGLLWVCDGNKDAVMVAVIFLQVYVLILTGLLVLVLVRQTTRRVGAILGAVAFFVALLSHFSLCFQFTHDSWLILLALDLLIAGFCWFRPFHSYQRASAWGLFGGLCALINPIVALVWGMLSGIVVLRERSWSRFAIVVLVAGLTLMPWTIRNYLVFGSWVPVKSNLAYELYQSQCLQTDGLIQYKTFGGHPYASAGKERQEYKALGEIAFLEKKKELFWQAVTADPFDFLDRVATRFLGTTLWYIPFNRAEAKRPWLLWSNRLLHPLPFLAALVLVFSAAREPLHWEQWVVISVYVVYLLPYIVASYYERYGVPLLGVKVLLVVLTVDRLWSCLGRKENVMIEPNSQSRQPTAATRRARPLAGSLGVLSAAKQSTTK